MLSDSNLNENPRMPKGQLAILSTHTGLTESIGCRPGANLGFLFPFVLFLHLSRLYTPLPRHPMVPFCYPETPSGDSEINEDC